VDGGHGRWPRNLRRWVAASALLLAVDSGPASAQTVLDDPAFALYRQGAAALEARDYDKATALAREAIAAYPDHVLAYYLLGQAALAQARWNEAVDAFAKVIARYPGSFAAHRDLGVAYQQLGRVDDTVRAWEAALALRPDQEEVRAHLALLLLNAGRQGRALPLLRALADGGTRIPEVYLALAHVAFDQGDLAASAAAFEKALALRDEGGGWFNLGVVRLRQGNQAAALQAFERAARHADTKEKATQEIDKLKSGGPRPGPPSRPGLPR
jgi:tetratricopeptide (TPR) repeat protein